MCVGGGGEWMMCVLGGGVWVCLTGGSEGVCVCVLGGGMSVRMDMVLDNPVTIDSLVFNQKT